MRLHSATGLFLGHKTLTGSAQTGYELTWARVDWHPSYGWMQYSVCILMHDFSMHYF